MPRQPLIDLTDERFDQLTVLYREPGTRHRSTIWMCLCDCGNYKTATRRALEAGDAKTCGMHGIRPPSFYEQAQLLWRCGLGRFRIAEKLGVTPNVISGVTWRNPDLFPPRPRATDDRVLAGD